MPMGAVGARAAGGACRGSLGGVPVGACVWVWDSATFSPGHWQKILASCRLVGVFCVGRRGSAVASVREHDLQVFLTAWTQP